MCLSCEQHHYYSLKFLAALQPHWRPPLVAHIIIEIFFSAVVPATVQFLFMHRPRSESSTNSSLHLSHEPALEHSRQPSAQPSVFDTHEPLTIWKPSKQYVQLEGWFGCEEHGISIPCMIRCW